MLDTGRCECGCRIFFNKQALVTTASGTIRDIPSMMVMECIRCRRTYLCSTECGKKVLHRFDAGTAGEKALFEAALESWKNIEKPERNASLIVLDDADKLDFERLGIRDDAPVA